MASTPQIIAREGHWRPLLLMGLLVVSSTVLAASHRAATATEWVTRRTISLAVVAPLTVNDSLLARTVAEAQAIWAPLGVRLDWKRQASVNERSTQWDLAVIVDRRRTVDAGSSVALGWIAFRGGDPEPSIHLSEGDAEALLTTAVAPHVTLASQRTLVSRALGRALAHEIGHYLMRSKAHTRSGLMMATRRSADFFSTNDRAFGISLADLQLLDRSRESLSDWHQ